MQILGMVLAVIGGVASIGFSLKLLVVAFKKSPAWGVACVLIPLAGLFFVAMNWKDAKRPFLGLIASTAVLIVASVLEK